MIREEGEPADNIRDNDVDNEENDKCETISVQGGQRGRRLRRVGSLRTTAEDRNRKEKAKKHLWG